MEYLDIVNEKDEVIGTASFEEVYAKHLAHRIVHILIFNENGDMALQMRSQKKTFLPGHWSTAVGGHVQTGESYEQAAKRECEEEIGIVLPLADFHYFPYQSEQGFQKFLGIFYAQYNGPFMVNPEEVDRVEFFSMDQVKKMMENGQPFHPELKFLLKELFAK